ncbi:MAG: nucleotidyltransferase, partial [Ruminococcaceae bacterium]|nr:nucleotidyltransferase [Oscillospiraceae bacterium]
MTLLILAAGMGSRYGGLKQLDPITDNGEFIIDFSVYDAMVSGFDKIVFVIKEENLELFRETIGKRFEDKVKVEYAFQKLDDLPAGYSVPEGRAKPWGTAQAMLAARHIVKEPFAVINADDFYGRSAYISLATHLKNAYDTQYCMVGYILENTLTENGTVSRGV